MCGDDAACRADQAMTGRRRKLWELQGVECSIVGTCLTQDDLTRLSKKLRLRIPDDAQPYDVHAFFVQNAGKDGQISRSMHKLLDRRHEGMIRKLAGMQSAADRETLWRKEYEAGRIAGAYWAFMTDGHVAPAFATRIFGEVHMLSHVLGRTTHHTATRASEIEARLAQLEAQALRQAQHNRSAIASRDATIVRLTAELDARALRAPEAGLPLAPAPRSGSQGQGQLLQKKERALISARERARSAEAEARRLREQVANLQLLLERSRVQSEVACPGAQACADTVQSDVARRILYIGGRTGGIEHLRRVAIQARAELVHHDGGEEQSLGRIDGLVEGCDAVFCPVDCVSHSACLKAKALCKKLQKPFVPLRSSGVASFERALSGLTAARGIAD